jgi:uncharacterized protein YegP (UPF0339 family)
MAKYVLQKSVNGQYHFSLQADNGEKVLSSEMYTSKQGALNGIQAVKLNSPYDQRYVKKVSVRGLPYFVLTSTNNEIIGTSEEYSTTIARDNAIALVKRIAPTAPTEDRT